jgi:hypothetical protein
VRELDIARWRLRSQHLVSRHAASARDVVGSLLAVQAENPSQAAWAVASRTQNPDQAELTSLLDDGAVVRTHVLRPTWHFVRAEDIGWLLDLTGPRIRRITGQQLRTAHGLDERSIDRAVAAVTEALASRQLTRVQLADELRERGIPGSGQLLMILLAHAELEGLICSGGSNNGEHTYALMSARVPTRRRLGRTEALAEIALRYFTGHGPATERDLAYWATLTVTDVRTGLEQVRDRLDSFQHDGRAFWHAPGEEAPGGPQEPAGHLLQILDETYRGYQDSRWVLDAAGDVPRGRETAAGMALVDAQLVATMRRTVATDHVRFDLRPYRPLTPAQIDALDRAARRYGQYLRLEARLTLP